MKNHKCVVFTDRSVMSVDFFLKDISKYKVLSQEEEYALWEQMRNGNAIARDRLINSNLRYVVSRAKRYLWSSVAQEDLVQCGSIGLIDAVDKFDASLGLRLVLFATCYIDSEIQKAVSSHSKFSSNVSLDDIVYKDEDCKLTMEEVVSSGRQDYADWNAMYGSAFQELKAVAKKLAPFEDAFIIWNDYLTMSELGYTLCDVAKKNHVTEEKAKEKIKDLNMRLSQYYGLRV